MPDNESIIFIVKVICPNCKSTFEVKIRSLPKEGKITKCFICGFIWTQHDDGSVNKIARIENIQHGIKNRRKALDAALNNNNPDKNDQKKDRDLTLNPDDERELLMALALNETQVLQSKLITENNYHQNQDNEQASHLPGGPKLISEPDIYDVWSNRTVQGFGVVTLIFFASFFLFNNQDLIYRFGPKYNALIFPILDMINRFNAEINNLLNQFPN